MSEQKAEPDHESKVKKFKDMQKLVGWSAAIGLAVSLGLTFIGWGQPVSSNPLKDIQVGVLVFWTLAPPIWFWYEYVYLFRSAFPHADSDKLNELKTQQDLSSKIWVAATSVLLILYFWKDLGGIAKPN